MEEQKITKLEQSKSVHVLYVNEEMQKHATNITSKLRQKGISVEIDLSGRPLKKQMESASESKFAIIIAPKEFSSKLLILRNMEDGEEKQITVDDLLKNPKSILNL